MNSIQVIAILLSTVLISAEGTGFEVVHKGINAVQQLIRIGKEIKDTIVQIVGSSDQNKCMNTELAEVFAKKIEFVAQKMDQLMDVTVGEPTCPGEVANGVYPLRPAHTTGPPFRVYCETGGWIVFHRRFIGELKFDRMWHEYRKGFGNLQGEFWLGLEKLHQLTRASSFELMVILKNFSGVEKWSKFDGFRVASEFEHYRLDLNTFVAGNAGNSMLWHNGMKFSTPDKDNDTGERHCAQLYNSGWWFKQCAEANLNGLYEKERSHYKILWYSFDQSYEGLQEARMMIRPMQACDKNSGFFGSSHTNND